MSAALLTKLIEAGTPAALVAEVAAELARAQAAVEILETRKAKDRQRKRTALNSGEIHGTPRKSEEVAEIHGTVLPNKEAPQTPKEINPSPCVRGTRARAKHPLPSNWVPAPLKPDGQAGMIVARKPAGWIERQLSKFKDHALQNNRQCSDWDAAWRNWIKQADEMDERGKITSGQRQQSGWEAAYHANAGPLGAHG